MTEPSSALGVSLAGEMTRKVGAVDEKTSTEKQTEQTKRICFSN